MLDHSLLTHFETFRAHKLALRSPQTVYQYRLNLGRFGEFLGRPPTLADLQDQIIAEALGWLLHTRKLSPGSVSKFRDNLCCLWRFLARKSIVGTHPDVPEVKEPHRAPVALTLEQLKRLWEYLRILPGDVQGIPACDWFCSLVAMCWDTGARKGELLGNTDDETSGLLWKYVDLERGIFIARAETVKGGLRDRPYRIRPATVEWLRRIEQPRRKKVWPWPWTETTFYSQLGRIMEANGIPDDRYHKMHLLRKCVATHLCALGGNATEALGHSGPEMTRAYVDRTIAPTASPIDFLPSLDSL